MLKIAFDPIYKYNLPEGHRFPMIKYELLPEQLVYENTISESQFFTPKKLSREQLILTHTEEYLNKLDDLNLTRKEIRNIGFPVRKELIERGKVISGGTYEGAILAMENKIAMNIAGGTHHSYSDRGEGFCIYNDIAISANLLLSNGLLSKVLVVDLDVHQGNGTAKIFENRPEVYTFSMHGEKNYPVRKERSDLDIGLPDGCPDDYYLKTLYNTLPKLLDIFQPEIIFYLSGVDVIGQDKLGRLNLSIEGCKKRDEFVLKTAHKNNLPIVCSMGGGYSPNVKDIITAHANTFRLAMDIFY